MHGCWIYPLRRLPETVIVVQGDFRSAVIPGEAESKFAVSAERGTFGRVQEEVLSGSFAENGVPVGKTFSVYMVRGIKKRDKD
jgi:hypothetical protein